MEEDSFLICVVVVCGILFLLFLFTFLGPIFIPAFLIFIVIAVGMTALRFLFD